jgi:hypothetical protein
MKASTIQNAMAFLERVQLTGKEVPAFGEVMVALSQEYQRLTAAPAPQAPPAADTAGIPPKHPAELAAE